MMDDKRLATAHSSAGLPARYVRWSTVLNLGRRGIYAFSPEFLRGSWSHVADEKVHTSKSTLTPAPAPALKPRSPTAYLDGLRGLASVAVFNYHFLFSFSKYATVGYGYDAHHGQNLSPIQLPFLRLLYDGATAVNIFFAVAGYVCSAKVLALMGKARHEKTLEALCGSMFRSVLRLYLPVLFVSFACANAAYLGAYERVRPTSLESQFPEASLRRFSSWMAQMSFWAEEMFKLTNPWNVTPFYPEHDQHLWSVAFELRMRLHLYAALLALALCRPIARLSGLIALAALYLLWNRWEGPLFFLGAALAQWDLIRRGRRENGIALNAKDGPGPKSNLAWRCVRLGAYITSLYLMSFPIKNMKYPSPGFTLLNSMIPSWYSRTEKFPKSIGVLTLLYLLATNEDVDVSRWQRLLNSELSQYLGKIMFAVYLIHGPVSHMVGLGIPATAWSIIGNHTAFHWWLGLAIGWGISLVITLWLAEVFTREVDARLAKLVRKAEKVFFAA